MKSLRVNLILACCLSFTAGQRAAALPPQPEVVATRLVAAGLPSERPAPGEVAEISFGRSSGVCSAWLSNGVRLHMRRMETAPAADIKRWNEEVDSRARLVVSIAGGALHEQGMSPGLSQLAAACWSTPGTRTVDAESLDRICRTKGIDVVGMAMPDCLRLSISFPPENIDAAMHVAHVLLTEPLVTADALAAARQNLTGMIEAVMRSERGPISKALVGTVYPDDDRLRLPDPEQLTALTVDDAQRFLDRAVMENPIEVSVVGDISMELALDAARIYLASLPARERVSARTFAEERSLTLPEGPFRLEVRGETAKASAMVLGGFRGADVRQIRAFRSLWLAARVLKDRVSSRLSQDGLAAADVSGSCVPGAAFSGTGLVLVSAIVSPEYAKRAAIVIDEEVDRLIAEPPSADELTMAAQQMIEQFKMLEADPEFWSEVLPTATYYGVDIESIATGTMMYSSISAEELRNTIRDYAQPESMIRINFQPGASPDSAE